MPNIKQISSLRNYGTVLEEVKPGNPVFLTRNGKGRYVILDNEEYDFMYNSVFQQMFDQLDAYIAESDRDGWVNEEDIYARFGLSNNA